MELMDLINKVDEAVTDSKYNKYLKVINSNDEYVRRLEDMDLEDDDEIESYIDEVFGEPQGLYKNTKEEQKRLLRRLGQDVKAYSGDMGAFRPNYDAGVMSSDTSM